MSKTRQRSTVAISFMPSPGEALLLAQQQGDPMPASEIHLTLAFLGDINDQPVTREELLASLTLFATEHGAVSGKINGAGAFTATGEGDLTVVYATFDSPALPAFRQSLVNHLGEEGISHSMDHGFVPHLTLFRVPSGTDFEMPLMPAIEMTFASLVLMWGDERVAIPLAQTHHEDEERAESDAPNYRLADTEGEMCSTCLFAQNGYCGLYQFFYQPGWVCDSWQPSPGQQEIESMTQIFDDEAVGNLQRVLNWIKGLSKKRTIKEVESWDGAASNYSDTDAYCSACLIDVNAAAGRDEKAQSHCMLPIREEGDSAETFVAQAVFAAAGGRGITQVKKPDDVPQESWDAAVTKAANQIIMAYGEMDRVAPASVYELAGKEPPEESQTQQRAISIQQAWDQIWYTIDQYDMANGTYTWPHDIYIEGDQMFLIASRDGKMFKAAMSFSGSDLVLGSFEPTMPVFVPPPNQQQMRVISRASNGRVRVAEIVATAVLNRVGEIDSTILFDNFIKHAHELDLWPAIDVLHINQIVVAHTVPGGLLREGACYVAVWEFDDTPLGRAAEQGYMADPGFWGSSIQFEVLARELVEVIEGVKVPVYTDGINRFITIAPESWAASFYTGNHIERSQIMDEKNKEILEKLLGEQADEAEGMVDGVNGRIKQTNQITRTQPDEPDTEADDPDPDEVPDAVEAEVAHQVIEVDFDDEETARMVAEALAQNPALAEHITRQVEQQTAELSQMVADLTGKLDGLLEQVTQVNEGIVGITGRLEVLEQDDEQQRERWLNDLPRSTVVVNTVTHRPREARVAGDGNGNGLKDKPMAQAAQDTLAKWREQRESAG